MTPDLGIQNIPSTELTVINMKTLNESFTDQEFAELNRIKHAVGKNWHDFLLEASRTYWGEVEGKVNEGVKIE